MITTEKATMPTTPAENDAQYTKRIESAVTELLDASPRLIVKHLNAMLTAYIGAKDENGSPEYCQRETEDAALTVAVLSEFVLEVEAAMNRNEYHGFRLQLEAAQKN